MVFWGYSKQVDAAESECQTSEMSTTNLRTYIGYKYKDDNKNGRLDPEEIVDANRRMVAYDGLVPCGKCVFVGGSDLVDGRGDLKGVPEDADAENLSCQFCHLLVMGDSILDFILLRLVPIIAVLMLVVSGVMFFFGGGDPGKLTTAKQIITSTIIGLVIIFAAFLIVSTILSFAGLADWTKELYKSWWQEGFFQISCQIPLLP